MNESSQHDSPARQELKRNLMDIEDLQYCHERYPGAISLILVRRTRAVIEIWEYTVTFHLPEEDHGSLELQAEGTKAALALKIKQPALWRLGFHIAAEAMLALRNGHKEFVRVSKNKRKSATIQRVGIS